MNAAVETNLIDVRDRLVERVAVLAAIDTPQKQIAAAVGLSEGRISQIVNTPAVAARIAELKGEKLEQNKMLNDGWDSLEEEALGCALEYMKTVKDPEYALRAAKVANTANRRHAGGVMNGVIHGNGTAQATINLSTIFVERLQLMQVNTAELSQERHIVDAMAVSEIETLLAPPEPDIKIAMRDIFQIYEK